VQGSIAIFGTYSISDKTLVLHVESGTWPSWTGTDQKRPLTSSTGNEMAWTLQASVGGTNVTTFRRLK
jgi:Lipocalin-like domain